MHRAIEIEWKPVGKFYLCEKHLFSIWSRVPVKITRIGKNCKWKLSRFSISVSCVQRWNRFFFLCLLLYKWIFPFRWKQINCSYCRNKGNTLRHTHTHTRTKKHLLFYTNKTNSTTTTNVQGIPFKYRTIWPKMKLKIIQEYLRYRLVS